jgi:2-keto-4-pentenoate hydratase/2-oxohepta-3-ene-1,7-dioic acid hydratase in catechol pathway
MARRLGDRLSRGPAAARSAATAAAAVLGALLIPRDEIGNPQSLGLCCALNGVRRQDANTAGTMFPTYELPRQPHQPSS